jgi:hypothetical protein
MASLLSGPGKKMIEQDLWKLADSIIDGAFSGLEELLVRNLIRFHRASLLIISPFLETIPSSSSSFFFEGVSPVFRPNLGHRQYDVGGDHRLATGRTVPSLRGIQHNVSHIRTNSGQESTSAGAIEGQGRGDRSP